MKRTMKIAFTVLAAAGFLAFGASAATAGEGCQGAKEEVAEFTDLSVEELETKMNESAVTVVDVNRDEFRSENGKIPGALLLTSSSEFDKGELPEQTDASLVFYCANTKCSASKKAAGKAVALGYTDVSVFGAGLMGWKDAGKKVEDVKVN